MNTPKEYCCSRYRSVRRPTRVVPIGDVLVGGKHPIVVQSMTTTPTQDVEATVRQARALAEAGCEIVRITAQNVKAAEALGPISKQLRKDGIMVPLVADIHFLPAAAMEAVKHVEKVRVNPGNYADKKRFAVREYSDSEYNEELERLHDSFTPLVLRAKELGRTLRIGTNHGSLSDRIMNRFGDSPEGMVQSALEFVRIAESHNFQNLILSLKSSNPKVMIAAYRLAAARMAELGMDYPLHLGVTEAGDGEDGRIKSAVGIGSLLTDGLGDTIRVSLTEDPVYEVPVARALADKTMKLWREMEDNADLNPPEDSVNPFDYHRRSAVVVPLSEQVEVGEMNPPAVILGVSAGANPSDFAPLTKLKDNPVEGWVFPYREANDLDWFYSFQNGLPVSLHKVPGWADLQKGVHLPDLVAEPKENIVGWILHTNEIDADVLKAWLPEAIAAGTPVALDTSADWVLGHALWLGKLDAHSLLFTTTEAGSEHHAAGSYRELAEALHSIHFPSPIWIRNHPRLNIAAEDHYLSRLLEASLLTGPLLCDGIGDLISVETEPLPAKSLTLAYNLLQAARARISKTEFVACPSCGRTLFDLQSTTQKIREKTGHLKGVTIAVMGCIVNGPGEMADADFGYVGGSPKKVNLYVGKECVKYHVPEEDAVEELTNLIREHGKWFDPEEAEATEP